MKPRSYAPVDKVWFNSKYINIKRNRKLKAKFFKPFQVLHLLEKQAYKLKLPKRLKINNVSHVSLLKWDTLTKEWVDKTTSRLEIDNGNSKGKSGKYKMEAICNSTVYAKEWKRG